MPLEITFLGHSGFLFRDGAHALAVDPFLTGNPLARHRPDQVKCRHIAISHGHEDHVGDMISIAHANKATVYGCHEVSLFADEQGCASLGMNPGGRIETEFGWIALTQAFHSSSYRNRYMGNPCGVVFRMGEVTVYHCGDTGLFRDMETFGEIYRPDIACIPIGDRYTMGPELGSRAAEWIRPKLAIPMHYGTFPILVKDPSGFRPRDVPVKVLKPGESFTYP